MQLSHEKIEELYEKFVKINYTDEYKHRYIPLPIEKNNKNWRWEDKDFPRIISLLEFETYIEKYNFQIDKLLIFNGEEDPELEYLKGLYKSYLNVNYEDSTEKYDLHNLQLSHKDFDFCILSQTLEHVYNPSKCLANIKKHLAPKGYLFINVPACNAPHSEPFHFYTGFTPMGLAALAEENGYKIREIGQWGNEEYLVKLWTRNPGWSDYRQLRNPGLNEIENPVITWALLQK
jgi:SAM-dependent methyltransferase